MMIQVAIVDESQYLRTGLREWLEAEPDLEVVGEFGEVGSAVKRVALLKPHVVLLSVTMPDVPGFEACSQMLDAAPDTRVVMLSARLVRAEIVATMMAGAAGYLTKDTSQSDLVRTVRANGHRELFIIAPVAECALKFLQHDRRAVDPGLLTRRERQVVILAARGLDNAAIAARLNLSQHTIRHHLSHIFTKLNISRRAELGVYGAMVGALDEDPDDR